MEFTGKITFIGKEEKVGQNEVPKLTFVVEETDAEYPNSIAIDLFKERIDRIKNYKIGDVITVALNFRAREYNERHFTNISAWKITSPNGSGSDATPVESKDDDLPF